MGRRTVLLIVSVLVAALGTSLVFMYVKTADARAAEAYDTRQVLKAVEIIQPGETLAQAQQAGKIAMGTVPNGSLLDGRALRHHRSRRQGRADDGLPQRADRRREVRLPG